MLYPVTSTPVQLASADQMAALLTNSGESPLYLYRSSAVSPSAYDMILPGGGASLQWPAKSELWAVTDPGVTPTTVSLLFTAGATFTPAPTKVELVSGTASIAADKVIAFDTPTTFNVSSAEYLYIQIAGTGTGPFNDNYFRRASASNNTVDTQNIYNLGTQFARSPTMYIMLEWGFTDTEFRVFSSQTFTTSLKTYGGVTRVSGTYANKLTVGGPELRITVTMSSFAVVGTGSAVISIASVNANAAIAGATPTPETFWTDTPSGTQFSFSTAKMLQQQDTLFFPLGARQIVAQSDAGGNPGALTSFGIQPAAQTTRVNAVNASGSPLLISGTATGEIIALVWNGAATINPLILRRP